MVYIEDWRNHWWNYFTDPEGWLYSSWSEEKYNQYLLMDSFYPLHLWMDYLLDKRGTSEYLDRYGMDYSDIHDPRKLSSTDSSRNLLTYGQRMVSKNINKLYR